MDLRVNLERIKHDILQLAEIGRDANDHGIYRMAFTDADMEGKRWLTERITSADLDVATDGAINVSAILPGQTDAPRVLVGSHIDTVPCAGALDGTLGVVAGLEGLRCLKENGREPERTLESVSYTHLTLPTIYSV